MDKLNLNDMDHLAVGLTRPPMFMGINIRLFFANLVICTLICVDAHTLLGIPLCIASHLVLVKFSINEPNFLFIRWKAFFKTPPILNKIFWGKTNSYEPW